MKGYKMVREDYTAFHDQKTLFEVGTKVHITPNETSPPFSQGTSVSKESHNPLQYNARYPWRLIEVQFKKEHIIKETEDKYVVSDLVVKRELEPWDIDLPNAKRVYDKIASSSKIRLQAQTEAKKKKIIALVKQHVSRLNRMSGKQEIILNGVKFYTIKEWASVRASVIHNDASNPFLPLQKICETGGVFYGIDIEGIARVIMPSKDEVN